MSQPATTTFVPEPAPQFAGNRDSDRWVNESFRVQARYRRVLVVSADGSAPTRLAVAALALNGLSAGAAVDYAVEQVFRSLQQATDAAQGGDLIAVLPGRYAGMEIGPRPGAGDEAYIHYKAMGKPGEVVIDAAPEGGAGRCCIGFLGAKYIIVQGFNVAGQTGPGLPPVGPDAGLLVGGRFNITGHPTHHIAVIECFSHHHKSWGLVTSGSHTVLLQDNCFARSCREHCAYISNGSDNYCIRRNVFFGSNGCGLHGNMDADCSIAITLGHELISHLGPYQPTPEYARRFLREATAIFGPNNFPDGRGLNHLVEQNVMNGNGQRGGAGINLANWQGALVQNNLVYGNVNHGIALYNDNARNIDRDAVMRLAESPDRATGPEAMPMFGACCNLIRNNTVLLDAPTRFALGLVNGAWGNVIRNNILINHHGLSIEVSAASLYRHDSGHNIANAIGYRNYFAMDETWPEAAALPEAFLALALGTDANNGTVAGIDLDKIAPHFRRYSQEPWVILEGDWWRLNPRRPDFRPRGDSSLLAGKADVGCLPEWDLNHGARASADIGAYRAAGD